MPIALESTESPKREMRLIDFLNSQEIDIQLPIIVGLRKGKESERIYLADKIYGRECNFEEWIFCFFSLDCTPSRVFSFKEYRTGVVPAAHPEVREEAYRTMVRFVDDAITISNAYVGDDDVKAINSVSHIPDIPGRIKGRF